jgi:alanyl-tRNA synthetase
MTSKKSDGKLKWTGEKVRQSYIDFFAERGHKVVASASLVPGDDPTLLFTNAGMVQFKDVFLGTGSREYSRAVDSQKCMRVAGKHNDLEDVGRDETHHTFFEMLGNWSFGDYYKEEAITWAWELLTKVWGLEKDRLWVTVFEDDQGDIPRDHEAAEFWRVQPGFNPDHILYFGREENFWEMADIGPCGPDSEIHYDRGIEFCTQQDIVGHVCQVNVDCGRYLELWNLVFIQYNKVTPQELVPLPDKHVDTGMGFERIVSVLQDVGSNYETDLFSPLLDQIQELSRHSDQDRVENITPYRVIADHCRAAAFMIADGVVPGNVGRNYVCRMIIRRASRFGGKIGFDEPFLASITDTITKMYGEAYPELVRNRSAILSTITEEEIRFHRTVEVGLSHLGEQIEKLGEEKKQILDGEIAFDLYATYGLPLEITKDILEEDGLSVDEEGFSKSMEEHRFASGSGKDTEWVDGDVDLYRQILEDLVSSSALSAQGVIYDPYAPGIEDGDILAIVKEGERVESASEGDSVQVILPESHFYVEAGGQVSDIGSIESIDTPMWKIAVSDARQPINGIITHFGTVVEGEPKIGDKARSRVDLVRKWDIMRNHTATHLLHAGLQQLLGDHARQAGSLVAPDRLRFDFTHSKALTRSELEQIEDFVNQVILENLDLTIQFKKTDEAMADGAMALFGETYGDTVRTISIGEMERISYELCGGNHVPSTGIIGAFLIVSEGSAAAGIRRIEAITGRKALKRTFAQRNTIARLSDTLRTTPEDLENRVVSLAAEKDALQREISALRQKLALVELKAHPTELVDGVVVLTVLFENLDMEGLLALSDVFRKENESGVALLASSHGGRPRIVAAITQDLVERGLSAIELVRVVGEKVGGSGGGKPHLAQAGGSSVEALPDALAQVEGWVRENLS